MEGIGRYLAEGLCEAGAEVVLINRSERMFTVRDYLREKGYAVHGVIADLGEREQLRRAFAESMELLGSHLDILVNCAGIQRRMPSVDFEEQAWDDVVNINLNAVFFLSQLAAREMIPQHKGKIINVAFAVSAAFVFGDHLGFTAGFDADMIFPMIVGKLVGGITAVAVAMLLTRKEARG